MADCTYKNSDKRGFFLFDYRQAGRQPMWMPVARLMYGRRTDSHNMHAPAAAPQHDLMTTNDLFLEWKRHFSNGFTYKRH
jgi:hypothetical protein